MYTADDVVYYVMHTPLNTNEKILRQMLDDLGGGGELPNNAVLYNAVNKTFYTKDGTTIATFTVPVDPTAAKDVANKTYVDSKMVVWGPVAP